MKTNVQLVSGEGLSAVLFLKLHSLDRRYAIK